MVFRRLGGLLMALAVALAPTLASAQAPADNPPVAVVSLVWGVVTIKHADADYEPARWLQPVYAGDLVKTQNPGDKLLITWFFDNHQEVIGPESVAKVDYKTLISVNGGAIRRDPPRNPFGTGMNNPFVYTDKLMSSDFQGADDPGAMDRENAWLQSAVKASYPPVFTWQAQPGVNQYKLQIFDTTNQFKGGATVSGTRFKPSPNQLDDSLKGSTLQWQVTSPSNDVVVPRYAFMVLTRPLEDWLNGYRQNFQAKKASGKLERSDYTDYLLAAAQLMQVDEVVMLTSAMAQMDTKNPHVFRALTRAYLAKGCPAHAKQAHDQELQLGGIDPIL